MGHGSITYKLPRDLYDWIVLACKIPLWILSALFGLFAAVWVVGLPLVIIYEMVEQISGKWPY